MTVLRRNQRTGAGGEIWDSASAYSNVVSMAVSAQPGRCIDSSPFTPLLLNGGNTAGVQLMRANVSAPMDPTASSSLKFTADVGLSMFRRLGAPGARSLSMFCTRCPPLGLGALIDSNRHVAGGRGGSSSISFPVPTGLSGSTRYRCSAVLSHTRTSTSSANAVPNSRNTPRGSMTAREWRPCRLPAGAACMPDQPRRAPPRAVQPCVRKCHQDIERRPIHQPLLDQQRFQGPGSQRWVRRHGLVIVAMVMFLSVGEVVCRRHSGSRQETASSRAHRTSSHRGLPPLLPIPDEYAPNCWLLAVALRFPLPRVRLGCAAASGSRR
jgi:hypothetical protein